MRIPGVGAPSSYGWELISDKAVPKELEEGWKSEAIPEKQHAAFAPLLRQMRRGRVREDFAALAKAVEMTGLADPLTIEVGCGSGWNSEVLTYLLGRPIRYMGLDYSKAMVRLGKRCYPNLRFVVGDAARLPLRDAACDILISGTVLMHLLGYSQAIRESRRVARAWCILHTVPVVQKRPTTILRKFAYGSPVVEVVFNEPELLRLIADSGLVVRHTLESIPYALADVLGESASARTYLCEVV